VLANVVSEEENVKGVLSKVLLGEADAGIVYRTDVAGSAGAQVTALDLPDNADVPIVYPIAVLRGSADGALARAFVELVLSDEGQAILRGFGFEPPPGP
jgi:molybdate transport system substrate-binding protein